LDFYWWSHKSERLSCWKSRTIQDHTDSETLNCSWTICRRRLHHYAGVWQHEDAGSYTEDADFLNTLLPSWRNSVNIGIVTRLKARSSRNRSSIACWRKRFISGFFLLGYTSASIGKHIPKFEENKCRYLHGPVCPTQGTTFRRNVGILLSIAKLNVASRIRSSTTLLLQPQSSQEINLCSKGSRLTLWPTQLPLGMYEYFSGLNLPNHVADRANPHGSEVKHAWSHITPLLNRLPWLGA
jgi:hypothetical protein